MYFSGKILTKLLQKSTHLPLLILLFLVFAFAAFPSKTFAQEYAPIRASVLKADIDAFFGAGADGFLVWQYSGDRGMGTEFENDQFSFFRNTPEFGNPSDPNTICGVLKQEADSNPGKFVGVNIWGFGNRNPAVMTDHINTLKACGVTVIRIFAKGGDVAGVQAVLGAAQATGVRVIVAIGDAANGDGWTPAGPPKSWYQSGYNGAYLSKVIELANAVGTHSYLYGFELANEPHCGNDTTAGPAYNQWAATVTQALKARGVQNVSIGQMALNPYSFCDNPDKNYGQSNSPSGINLTSAHYYEDIGKGQALKALAVAKSLGKTFYIGEASEGGAPPEDGGEGGNFPEHSCKRFCRGTSADPCLYTQENDCSFPFNSNEFLAPVSTMISNGQTEQEVREKILDMNNYLLNYIIGGYADVARGAYMAMKGDAYNSDYCNPDSSNYLGDICKTASGDIITKLTNTDTLSSALTPGDLAGNDLLNQNSAGYMTNLQGASPFEFGSGLRNSSRDKVWQRLAIIEDLKETCYSTNDGKHIVYQTVPFFGNVRCMNYQRFDCSVGGNCPGNLRTERDVFRGPLSVCLQLKDSIDPEILANCEQAFNQLPEQTQEAVKRLPITPIARYPLIYGYDNMAPEQEQDNSADTMECGQPPQGGIFERIIAIFTHNCFNFQDTANTGNTRQFESKFQMQTVVTGLDAKAATQVVQKNLTPIDKQVTPAAHSNFDYNSFPLQLVAMNLNILLTNDASSPFWKTHLTEIRQPGNAANTYNDYRFAIISFFLNRHFSKCTTPVDDLDRTLIEVQAPITGAPSNVFETLLNAVGAALDDIIHFTTNVDTERFVFCPIVPSWLNEADDLAAQITKNFIPIDKKARFVEERSPDQVLAEAKKTNLETSGKVEIPPETGYCINHVPICDGIPNVGDCDGAGNPQRVCCSALPDYPGCVNFRPAVGFGANIRTLSDRPDDEDPLNAAGTDLSLTTQGGSSLYSTAYSVGTYVTKPIDKQPSPECSTYENILRWLSGDGTCSKGGGIVPIPPSGGPFTCNESQAQPAGGFPGLPGAPSGPVTLASVWSTTPYPDFRNPGDTYCDKNRIITVVKQSGVFPGSQIDTQFDYVVAAAKAKNVSPAFALAMWIEESGASDYQDLCVIGPVADFGIAAGSTPRQNIQAQLNVFTGLVYGYNGANFACLQNRPPFEKFMLAFSEGGCSYIQPNNFTFTRNPAFPGRVKRIYQFVKTCS